MNHQKMQHFFSVRRDRAEPLVLATVYETRGSTYSKAGARMLVDANGIFQGMLSGGCLEGDLAMRARAAVESGDVQFAEYDLAADNDELWGMGVGCDGLMRVFLQPLSAANGYEPLASVLELESAHQQARLMTVIESMHVGISAGASVVIGPDGPRCFGIEAELSDELLAACQEQDPSTAGALVSTVVDGEQLVVLHSRVEPVPRVLVLGAGLDAVPLVKLADELGWRCTVVDHRPAYVQNEGFKCADKALCMPVAELSRELNLDDFDLAIVMSHHLLSDRCYLEQLAAQGPDYVGLLGPPGRRQRLLRELGEAAAGLDERLHGPAGLDIGGRGPAAIALSIVAQMQNHLARRASLT